MRNDEKHSGPPPAGFLRLAPMPKHLEHRYPTWNIRELKPGGEWWATRRGGTRLTDEALIAGLSMTLVRDTPDQLAEALAQETEIENTL